MLLICFLQSALRNCFFEEYYDAIMKMTLSSFKTNGDYNYEMCFQMANAICNDRRVALFVYPCARPSSVYGKLNRNFSFVPACTLSSFLPSALQMLM